MGSALWPQALQTQSDRGGKGRLGKHRQSTGWGKSCLPQLPCHCVVEQQTLNRPKLPGMRGRLTGAVQFHRRQAELLGDVCVFDGQGFLHLKCEGKRAVLVNLTLLRVGRTHLRIGCLGKLLSNSTQFLGRTATVYQGISSWGHTPGLPGWVSKNKTCSLAIEGRHCLGCCAASA